MGGWIVDFPVLVLCRLLGCLQPVYALRNVKLFNDHSRELACQGAWLLHDAAVTRPCHAMPLSRHSPSADSESDHHQVHVSWGRRRNALALSRQFVVCDNS